jgi:hypothetical protein
MLSFDGVLHRLVLSARQVLRLPLDEFRRLMVSGEMLLPSITTAYMALDRLAELGLL